MIEGLKPYEQYKESDIPWARMLPSSWQTERAKRLFTKMQRPVRPEDEVVTCFRDGMVTLRKNRRLRGFTEATVYSGYQGIRKGDLVIHGMDAFAGAIGVSDSDGKATPVYNVCQPGKGVVASYYAHTVREMSRAQWILALAKGIRERSTDFRFEMFGNQFVPLPPPVEQAAIVRFLDHANRKIDGFIRAKRKLIGLLNEQKQAIIHRAVTRGLHPAVPLKPSGIPWLGDIPKHWKTMRLKNACKIRGGFAFKTDLFRADGVPVIRMSNLRRGTLDLTDAVRIAENDCVAGFELKAGDILYGLSGSIGATGSLGNFAVVADGDLPAQLNQRVARFRPDGRVLSIRFLVFLIHTSVFYDQVLSDTTGTAQFNVSTNDVGKVTFSVPTVSEQNEICDRLEGVLAKPNDLIARTEREIALMQEYRTRLTADLVTGKLDVRKAAAKLPEQPSDSEPMVGADALDEGEILDETEPEEN
jgi:type I restriction enzyme S subunit